LAEFTDGLEDDLKSIKYSMAEHARNADSYFEGVKIHAENLKIKLQESVEAFSGDFKVSALHSTFHKFSANMSTGSGSHCQELS